MLKALGASDDLSETVSIEISMCCTYDLLLGRLFAWICKGGERALNFMTMEWGAVGGEEAGEAGRRVESGGIE